MAGQNQIRSENGVAESYPLSPMQQGMLFHNLSAPHSGVDIEQVICTLWEDLRVAAFRQAWERVVERHAILRTGFHWGDPQPHQEVHRRARLHFEQKDWRGLSELNFGFASPCEVAPREGGSLLHRRSSRYWHKADIPRVSSNVCYWVNSGHPALSDLRPRCRTITEVATCSARILQYAGRGAQLSLEASGPHKKTPTAQAGGA